MLKFILLFFVYLSTTSFSTAYEDQKLTLEPQPISKVPDSYIKQQKRILEKIKKERKLYEASEQQLKEQERNADYNSIAPVEQNQNDLTCTSNNLEEASFANWIFIFFIMLLNPFVYFNYAKMLRKKNFTQLKYINIFINTCIGGIITIAICTWLPVPDMVKGLIILNSIAFVPVSVTLMKMVIGLISRRS